MNLAESGGIWAWVAAVSVGFFFGAVIAGLWIHLRAAKKRSRLEAQLTRALAEATAERRVAQERERAFRQAEEHLEGAFSLLADRALDRSGRAFLRMAEERLERQRGVANADLAARQSAVEGIVKPLKEALERTQKQVQSLESERREAQGALQRHLELLAADHRDLRQETRNLVQALRRPEVRGRWGELTLRRLVDLAGMVEHCDFEEQVYQPGEDGASRPDMVVRLPDDRSIVVDVKTPLDAYLSAQEATSPEAKKKALKIHARQVRKRVRELAGKAYWEQFAHSADFVVLFLPGEQFMSAAMDQDRNLFEDALRDKVILASPSTLVAILRSVAFSWRQLDLIRNAERIRSLAETFYKRVGVFSEHYGKLSRSLASTVDAFNKSVGSLNRQVLPAALRLSEMGVAAEREIESLHELEAPVRDVPPAKDDGPQ